MTATRRLWGEVFEVPATTTADDLLRLPDDGSKYELFEGVLVREGGEMTSAGHSAVCQRLGGVLFMYAQATSFPNQILQNALFDLTPPGGATRLVLAPDVAIMRATTPVAWTVPTDSPLLAAEVVSPSQSLAELALKAQTYLRAGVEEVWVVDHGTRTVQLWNARGTTTLNDTQALTSPLLPGFSIDVRFLLDG
jgi:Uma2 family endonuclease